MVCLSLVLVSLLAVKGNGNHVISHRENWDTGSQLSCTSGTVYRHRGDIR